MKVLIVDDHALFRHGLSLILTEMFDEVEVTEARNADQAIEKVTECEDFGLVLLDLAMPGMNAFEGLDMLVDRLPDIPVVIVSGSENGADIRAAFQRGAKGYIFKSSAADVLKLAIPLVLSGEVFVPAVAIGAVGVGNPDADPSTGDEPNLLRDPSLKALTPRQKQVLILLAHGQSNKEIARKLGMLEGTVKVHVKAILKKLGVHNRTQAVVTGVRLGHLPQSIMR